MTPYALADELLTLHDAIARALAYAPSRETAVAQSDLSAAQMAAARAPLLPTISANGAYEQAPGYDPTISNRGLTQAQLALAYDVYDGGRRLATLSAARYTAEAARLGIDVTRAQIVFDTTVAYFDLLRARAIVANYESSINRLSQYLRVVKTLEHSGRAIPSDVLKLRSVQDTAELTLATAHQEAARTAATLGALLGDPETFNAPLAKATTLPELPKGEITQNPTFAAAQREIDAAQASIRAAKDERAPVLALALTAGWQGIDPPSTFNNWYGASYGGTLAVPIFDGGLIRAHIDEAKATAHIAAAKLREIQLQLKRDLADARSRYLSAVEQLDILKRAQVTADDSFALDWTRFLGGGNVTILEVADSYQVAETLRITGLQDEYVVRQAAAQAALLVGAGS